MWSGVADLLSSSSYPRHDVSADGESFVVKEVPPENQPKVNLAQNWFAEFEDQQQD